MEATPEPVASRRWIIKRPRLTQILDASEARLILLVAPAGYGKTTLAHEWLDSKRAAWYRGTPASADVAALAVGLATAAAEIVPGAGNGVRQRLRAAEPSRRRRRSPGRDAHSGPRSLARGRLAGGGRLPVRNGFLSIRKNSSACSLSFIN